MKRKSYLNYRTHDDKKQTRNVLAYWLSWKMVQRQILYFKICVMNPHIETVSLNINKLMNEQNRYYL